MVRTQWGNAVEILAVSADQARVAVKRLSDGATYEVPLYTLKADGGPEEVFRECEKTSIALV